MAYLHTMVVESEPFSSTFFKFHNSSEKLREIERKSAITIQSWFRSVKVQMHIKFLHECSLLIQKTYRGFVTRKFYRTLVNNVMASMMQAHYDKMATRIQARWRGYYVRKFRADYYCRRAYMEGVVRTNEMTLAKLHEVGEVNRMRKEMVEEEKAASARLYEQRRTHHLLSTQVCKGVFNSPTKSDHEMALQSVKPLSREERKQLKLQKQEKLLRSSTGIPCESQDEKLVETIPTLPPIVHKKPQGPFREPGVVQKQRFKQLEPTLRVATDYTSVDKARVRLHEKEWTRRVIDETFLPCKKTTHEYEPTLHTTSSFGKLEYGTKHFREPVKARTTQVTHTKPFQKVVSPIPYFDQVGKTY